MSDPLSTQLDQLRNTLGKMEVAFSALRDAIVWTDQDGQIQWCNQAFFSMIGKSRISLIGKRLADVFALRQHDRPVPPAMHPANLLVNLGDGITSLYQYIKDGQRLDIEVSATCIWEQDAKACSVIMIIRDITELQLTEEVRIQGEALEAAASAIIIGDQKGHIKWVNPAYMKMSGYTLEECIGKPFGFPNPARQDKNFLKGLLEGLKKGNKWQKEISNRRKDGLLYHEQEIISPVFNAQGELKHFIAIKVDITDRKRFEAAILEREARIEAILKSATDSIIIIDERGSIQSFNDAALHMFGYASEELAGQNVRILMPEPHHSAHDGYLSKYIQSKRPHVIGVTRELQAVKKDGRIFPIELSLSEAKVGKQFLFSGFIRDITMRKAIQDQLEKTHSELLIKQKLINADLKAAAGIQFSLLPQSPPTNAALTAAWKFRPSSFVGGDIFNFFQIDADHFVAYIVDVSGHGVPSALISVSIYQTLSQNSSTLFSEDGRTLLKPSQVMQRLEDEFPIERFNNFFTIFFMVVNLRTGTLTYSSAGHPPALLLREDAPLELLDAGGMIIGAGAKIPFAEASMTLRPGDKLILYTDGTYEYMNEHEQVYGLDRFFTTAVAHRDKTITETIEGTFQEVLEHGSDLPPQDDISLLGFEYM